MLFKYEAVDAGGGATTGSINATSQDAALTALQRRGLTVTSLKDTSAPTGVEGLLSHITLFSGVSNKDVVFLSREIATLFEAQVSALRTFQLLAEQAEKAVLRSILTSVIDDLQAGDSLSKALAKHPKAFSEFYVNMVRAGEESGKLDQTFIFLADYLDRSFELASKARNALIYPAFVLVTFFGVLTLMLTLIIPKIEPIIEESGATIPIYTQLVLNLSNFFVDYGVFLLVFLVVAAFIGYRWVRTETGARSLDHAKINAPLIGNLFRKLYLVRIADNMHAMLQSGIAAVRSLEITASVVGNLVYRDILLRAVDEVKGGAAISVALARYPDELPAILVQMMKVGEETGELSTVLERLARFYQREVNSAVDTLVNLIEPILIVVLAVGVGFLLAAILLPIYNLANSL